MTSKPVFYDEVADHEHNILNVFIAMTDNYMDYPVFASCSLLSICTALASLTLLSTNRG